MLEALIEGLLLGLGAGMTPGPLSVLVIGTTLRHGPLEGLKVSLAPILSDLPIIAGCLFLVGQLSRFQPALGAISLAGATFILYLAWETFTTKGVESGLSPEQPRSIRKGILVNVLSPHPYLFWFTVGAARLTILHERGLAQAALFLICFYFCLVGSKMTLAFITGRARGFLSGKPYLATLKVLAGLLAFYALYLVRDGLDLLGIFPQ